VIEEQPTLRGLLKSLFSGFLDLLRQNRLAACLASIAFIVSTTFAVNSHYDERPRYREVILPDILKAEAQLTDLMRYAESAPSEDWRLFYFLSAHRKAKNFLQIAKSRKPRTAEGIRAHNELIRYCDLLDEGLAIIRTEMSLHEDLDYMTEWKNRSAELAPLRAEWSRWVETND
jgi:hypothetical protein